MAKIRCVFRKTVCIMLAFLLCGGLACTAGGETVFQPSQVIVSMGDSYSSGEGITPFYGQQTSDGRDRSLDEKLNNQDWLAHRSEKSWSGRLKLPGFSKPMSEYKGTNWFFVAASGATTRDVWFGRNPRIYRIGLKDIDKIKLMVNTLIDPDENIQYENIDIWSYVPFVSAESPISWVDIPEKDALDVTNTDPPLIDPQLKTLEDLKNAGIHVDYVTMTIGGNNLGFTNIVTKVILGNNIYDKDGLNDMLKAARATLYDDGWGETYTAIYGLYKQILDLCEDEDENTEPTQLIIAGYPRLFSEYILENAFLDTADKYAKFLFEHQSVKKLIGDLIGDISGDNPGTYALGLIAVTQEEARLVNEAVMEFNDTLKSIVEALNERGYENIHYVDVAGEGKFLGHEAFSADPYLNPVILLARSEDMSILTAASAYSIHPNSEGAQVYADCVQKKIDQLEALKRYHYAMNRLTRDGSWYEGVRDEICYSSAGMEGECIDVYDVQVSGFKPELPAEYTASGEGYRFDGTKNEECMYDVSVKNGDPQYKYFFYNMLTNMYDYDEEYSKAHPEPGNSPWPELYPIAVFTDYFLTDDLNEVEKLDEFSFTMKLSEKTYRSLGLDVDSIVTKWNSNQAAEPDDSGSDPLFNFPEQGKPEEYLNEYYRSISDPDALMEYILKGYTEGNDDVTIVPDSTKSVKMEVHFHQDMTFDSIRFITTGTVINKSTISGGTKMNISRELTYHLSDQKTEVMNQYFDEASEESGGELPIDSLEGLEDLMLLYSVLDGSW